MTTAAGEHDVVVVGAGAAGLAAATTARRLGARVLLVSDGEPGGDCTWTGCVPTKSLLEAAAAGLGLEAALAHARRVVERVARSESVQVLQAAGVDVLRGRASLLPEGPTPGASVRLGDGSVLRPRHGVVLATGSRPRPLLPPGAGLSPGAGLPDGTRVVTTDDLLGALDGLAARPGPVTVLGAGPTGVEAAQALARLGGATRVRLLERADCLLPGFPDVSAPLAASLLADGVLVETGTTATLSDLAGHLVVLALGRTPDTAALPATSGVECSSAGVVVDDAMRTTRAGVTAAGDITGVQPSTHVAAATGRVAAATLLGVPATFDRTWAPRVVYTDPEVAVVGRVGGSVAGHRQARVPFSRLDRALAAAVPVPAGGAPGHRWVRGCSARLLVRCHDDRSWAGGGVVDGAIVVGPHAADLVSEVAVAGRLGLDVAAWVGGTPGLGALSALHPYPSWSWVWSLAADDLLTR